MEDSDQMSEPPPTPPPPPPDGYSPSGPSGSPGRNRWWVWVAAVVVVAAIAGLAYAAGSSGKDGGNPTAAGSPPATGSPVATPSSPSPTASLSAEPSIADEDSDGNPDSAECQQQLGGLMKALKEIDSRLDVGLTQSELNGYVGDASVEYDRARFGSLPTTCTLTVGVPLENALNNYIKSNNRWNSCISNFGCDVDSIDPYLQKQWAAAAKNLRRASAGLRQPAA